jgi:rhodanese-related sulfurtransferase
MMKKLLVLLVGMGLVLSMVNIGLAADAEAPPMNPKVKEMIASAKAAVKTVSAEEAKKVIDSKEKVVFLDVRDPGEFAAGHFPGAVNISRGTLEMNVFGKIPDQNAKIYVYCKTAGRSALATKVLNDLGYKNACLVDAQYADWVKAGYPVER